MHPSGDADFSATDRAMPARLRRRRAASGGATIGSGRDVKKFSADINKFDNSNVETPS